jgi:predicted O-linked N-acetylglucosamine transferase (SPINDLY family)
MARNRLPVFARRAAPVQVAYPGYPNTSGLSRMDYLITDVDRAPPGSERWFTEKLIRLPVTSQCYRPGETPDVSPPPCVVKGYVTFACLNKPVKIAADVARIWAEILRAVPESRLAVLAGLGEANGPEQRGLRERLVRWGLPGDRIDLMPPTSRQQYLARHADIDIILDTFPYAGHTTTLDAIWMGVPVVTLYGAAHLTREGFAVLKQTGLPELACETPEDYITAAVGLAADRPRLASLRTELRERLTNSPLLDAKAATKNLEAALRAVWTSWRGDEGVSVPATSAERTHEGRES